ncbi:MAG: hypothetical protein WCX93_04720 [Burkholderiaceae bacterium]
MATASDKAKDVIEEVADKTDKAISTAASKASSATRRTRDAAHQAVDDSTDVLEGALICAKDMVRANPIASVAVVAAIAYLWGRMR